MLKLIRDWLEKFSVGSLLVAVYQGTSNEKWVVAYLLGAVAFASAFYLAKRGVK